MHWRQFQELQKVAEIGERFVSYVDVGEGPAVVLLHGLPTWGFLFHRLAPHLERGHRVLIPDLPGCGFSDRSDRFSRALGRQAERVAAWMEAVGVERAAVVGHDAGAAVALRLALSHPERVERLALLDAAAYDAWPAPFLHELGHPSMNKRLTASAAVRRLSRVLEAGFCKPEPELTAGLLAPYATETGKLSLIRCAAALECGETMELACRFSRLRRPTLVLWGERDVFQPLDAGRRLAWELPQARLIIMPEAGHFALLERPAELAGHLESFLKSEILIPGQS